MAQVRTLNLDTGSPEETEKFAHCLSYQLWDFATSDDAGADSSRSYLVNCSDSSGTKPDARPKVHVSLKKVGGSTILGVRIPHDGESNSALVYRDLLFNCLYKTLVNRQADPEGPFSGFDVSNLDAHDLQRTARLMLPLGGGKYQVIGGVNFYAQKGTCAELIINSGRFAEGMGFSRDGCSAYSDLAGRVTKFLKEVA
jgi:hypothetical protein